MRARNPGGHLAFGLKQKYYYNNKLRVNNILTTNSFKANSTCFPLTGYWYPWLPKSSANHFRNTVVFQLWLIVINSWKMAVIFKILCCLQFAINRLINFGSGKCLDNMQGFGVYNDVAWYEIYELQDMNCYVRNKKWEKETKVERGLPNPVNCLVNSCSESHLTLSNT